MDPVELEDAAVELMGNVKILNLSLAFSLGGFAVIGLGFFFRTKDAEIFANHFLFIVFCLFFSLFYFLLNHNK
jgi:hypothetical protein